MPSLSTCTASSTSSTSSSRRRCLRTSTGTSTNNGTSQRNSSGSNQGKKNSSSSRNSIVSNGDISSRNSTSSRWPLIVSPITSLKSPSSSTSSRNSHDFISRNSSNSNIRYQTLPPLPAKPPVVTTTTTTTTRTTSPRSVVVSLGSNSNSSHNSPSSSYYSPTATTSRNNNNNNSYTGNNNNNNRRHHALLHAAQTHSSLELTTVAEADAFTMWSCGSTASGDSFILPLDTSLDDHGFFLQSQPRQEQQQHQQHQQLESESLLLLDESFEDPYLLQKEQVRLRNKQNKKRTDERDYFCNGSSKSTCTSSNHNNNHLQHRSNTVDTECSTAAADSAKTVNTISSSVVLAVRYLHHDKGQEVANNNNKNNNSSSSSIIPPLSRLHGLPPRKHFGETDQLSVPSQNEDHGGDVDDDDFHHDYHIEQEEVEILRRVEEQQDNNNSDNFGASLASIEVDDQQGILMSNSVSCNAATLQKTRAAEHAQALYYWNTRLTARIMTHGQLHFCTAEAWLELGNAHLEAKEYHAAFRAFSCAQRIIQTRYAQERPVALARALDRMGVACSKTARHVVDDGDSSFSTKNNFVTPEQTFQKAMELLLEALRIRHHELGPWHVDTVDCLNHLAWVQYDAGLYDTARRSFWEVFFVRKAIFGSSHPGVAVAAHDLANCFFKLGQLDNADNFYSIALEIYDAMNVPIQNPAVARLLRDMKRLERLQKTF